MSAAPPITNSTGCRGFDFDPPVWTYVLGIMLGLSASIGVNVGNNVQALGLAQQAERGEEKHNRVFRLGTYLFIVASIVNFAAFGLAPAAVLAPLEAVQFVSNLLFAKFVNNVFVTRAMVGGSFLIVMGTAIAVAFGPNQVAQFTTDDLVDLWAGPEWLIYLTFNASLAFGSQALHVAYDRASRSGHPYPHSAYVLPVSFALSSALAGSHCVVQAKCMSELFEIFLSSPVCVLSHWFFYYTLILLFIFLPLWLSRLNAALSKYDPLFIIPLLQSNYILFSTLTGGVFFQEFAQLDAVSWGFFVVGILIMFFGLFILVSTTAAVLGVDGKVHPAPSDGAPSADSPSRVIAFRKGAKAEKSDFKPATPLAVLEVGSGKHWLDAPTTEHAAAPEASAARGGGESGANASQPGVALTGAAERAGAPELGRQGSKLVRPVPLPDLDVLPGAPAAEEVSRSSRRITPAPANSWSHFSSTPFHGAGVDSSSSGNSTLRQQPPTDSRSNSRPSSASYPAGVLESFFGGGGPQSSRRSLVLAQQQARQQTLAAGGMGAVVAMRQMTPNLSSLSSSTRRRSRSFSDTEGGGERCGAETTTRCGRPPSPVAEARSGGELAANDIAFYNEGERKRPPPPVPSNSSVGDMSPPPRQ